MPTRNDFATLNALIAEAVALCEAAQEEFERTHAELRKAIDEGRAISHSMFAEEDRAPRSLYGAHTLVAAAESIRLAIRISAEYESRRLCADEIWCPGEDLNLHECYPTGT